MNAAERAFSLEDRIFRIVTESRALGGVTIPTIEAACRAWPKRDVKATLERLASLGIIAYVKDGDGFIDRVVRP